MVFLEELICSESDTECLQLLCPLTMTFDPNIGKCFEKSGHQMSQMGVVGSIKQMCRDGFVWVDWKEKCLRRS